MQKNQFEKIHIPGREYSHKQLKKAFYLVADPSDWKGPISAWVKDEDLDLVLNAIEYFTAVKGHATQLPRGVNAVTCQGYRMGPAA